MARNQYEGAIPKRPINIPVTRGPKRTKRLIPVRSDIYPTAGWVKKEAKALMVIREPARVNERFIF